MRATWLADTAGPENGEGRGPGHEVTHWIKLRKQALERDGHQCQLRASRYCAGVADTVHLAPQCGGNHWNATLDDCTSACRSCHGTVDAPRATQ